jgi:DivIVA domain-containing protein
MRAQVREPPRVPAEIRTVAFPAVGRGYDRRAVDAYVARVNGLITELEATRSPETVLERAFERSEEQRRRILRDAREAAVEIIATAEHEAEKITSAAGGKAVDLVVTAGEEAERAKAHADDHVAKARAEAEQILVDAMAESANRVAHAEKEIEAMRKEAEAWLRALRIDTNAIWGERRALLADLRDIAARLEQTAARSVVEGGVEHDSSS